MSERKRIERVVRLAFVFTLALASRAALATTIYLEAENARAGGPELGGSITTPLLIKDDPAASHGSYIEVIAGNDSKTSMPAAEGVTALNFENPDAAATFTIWARVIAPTDGDDSFWLKMDGGSAIKWNEIPLGSAWHWVHVKADGASSPASFTLGTGSHVLKIAYREDGTKLDELIITSDAGFDPNAPLSGPPATPTLSANSGAASLQGTLVSWQEVPGAQSYTLLDDQSNVIAAGLTGHTSIQGDGCFRVMAVGSAGTSALLSNFECANVGEFLQRRFPENFSLTPPMQLVNFDVGTKPGTAESLNAVPAHGRARYDFRVVGPTTIRVWAEVGAPDPNNDSFWVRVDQGAWVKWNNISPVGCVPVHNSDNGGALMSYSLATGSHFVEFAYREIGTTIQRLAPTSITVDFTPCED
jgi:hypothetical protein